MDNQKKLIRFFPFALTRIERLRDYLNRMYESGYQIVKIKFGCILIFQKAAVKEGFKYFILTRHFYSKARVKKWDDVDLLENISLGKCNEIRKNEILKILNGLDISF